MTGLVSLSRLGPALRGLANVTDPNTGGGVPANALILRNGTPLVLRDGSPYLLRTN